MQDQELEDLVALLPPLLQAIEVLGFVSRYIHPPGLASLLDNIGEPDAALRGPMTRVEAWPDRLLGLKTRLTSASQAVFRGFEGLREAARDPQGGMGSAYRALGQIPRAMEALYPLAADLPPVSRFFMSPDLRGDEDRLEQLAQTKPSAETGLFNAGAAAAENGGFAVYVPEDYSPDRTWPLVVALHGGSGNGRNFLWTWLRDARSAGAILVAPTSTGRTWALAGRDTDTPFLGQIVDMAKERWRIDESRMLLTGMSDGGSFTFISGLEAASPFTHLAPISTGFHPVMAQMADRERLSGLPIYLAHGTLDWMFDIGMARQAAEALTAVGAAVTWREIEDLSHTYPRELNPQILAWMGV